MYLVFNADRIPVIGEVSLQVAAGVFHGRDKSFQWSRLVLLKKLKKKILVNNVDVDIVGQYHMLFMCYAVTSKSEFWAVKAKDQIPNLKDFKDCENGYLIFILKWLSFYRKWTLKHLISTVRCIC